MCMSPHEMSTERIEAAIANMKEWIDGGNSYWEWRLEQFEAVLKERANNGTI